MFMITEQCKLPVTALIYGEGEMQILCGRFFAAITTAVTMATAIMTTSATQEQK